MILKNYHNKENPFQSTINITNETYIKDNKNCNWVPIWTDGSAKNNKAASSIYQNPHLKENLRQLSMPLILKTWKTY